jgi:RNA polymerase sigma-70 factor (ECF subfamily)
MKTKKNKHFETIYHQHHQMVLQMCLGFVKGDRNIANDLLQDVFISIWNNLEKFKGESSYKTWIYRITVNTCLQHVNAIKKDKTVSFLEVENQLPTVEPLGSSYQNAPDLYQAIGQLKEVDRLIIMMVLENQDYDNISEIIGVSPVNLRVKIHRIKDRLKNILKNNSDE